MAKVTLQAGYTLIELVIVAGLFGMLSITIVGVFFSTLRARTQAQWQAELRMQGDYTITTIERALRSATSFPTCTSSGVTHTLSIPTLNESKQSEHRIYTFSTSSHSINYKTRINATETTEENILSNVQLSNLSIQCTPNSGNTPGYVIVQFTLEPPLNSGLSDKETFQTRVAMRNIR